MLKTIFLGFFILMFVNINAQKKVECKKGAISVDGKEIAEFDGKGGAFSSSRRIWVLSPVTKDTLLVVHQITNFLDNPLIEEDFLFRADIYDAEKSSFYVKNPAGWGFVKEAKVLSLFFADDLPLLIEDGKLSASAIKTFKEQFGYNFQQLKNYIKQVEDSVKAGKLVYRDKSLPLQFVPAQKTIVSRLYTITPPNDYSMYYIKQGGIIIGALQKVVKDGSFPEAYYHIYRAVEKFTVGGINVTFIPISYTGAAPKAGNPLIKAQLYSYADKQTYKIGDGNYNSLETLISNYLIQKDLL